MKSCYELFGVECGPGWRALIEPLVELCQKENVAILQIKEKFGTLRFYVGAAPDHVYDAIRDAENESAKTCEQCGAPGKLQDNGWLRTVCKKHRQK